MIPSQKMGMENPNRATNMLSPSNHECCRVAATTPVSTPTTDAMSMAPRVSSIVAGKRLASSTVTRAAGGPGSIDSEQRTRHGAARQALPRNYRTHSWGHAHCIRGGRTDGCGGRHAAALVVRWTEHVRGLVWVLHADLLAGDHADSALRLVPGVVPYLRPARLYA